jgi:invasion protein IalB
MLRTCRCALVAVATLLLQTGAALAQTGGQASPGAPVPKPPAQDAAANANKAGAEAPSVKIAGNFGQWAFVCNEPKTKEEKQTCSLVQALVERDSQKLVFRLTVGYGPKGNLALWIDGPTGVALQSGLEFSPDAVKVYRMPFQTCLPQGCSAVVVIADDLKQDLEKAKKGTITVYALGGQAVRAFAELSGFADGLAALNKSRPKP